MFPDLQLNGVPAIADSSAIVAIFTFGLGVHPALALAIAVPVAALFYAFVVRPWHMRWGTRGDEATRPLPGDDLVKHPIADASHGITINATAEEIWPWIVQIGQGRGGFYSYDWLENLFGCDIHNVDHVMPELQDLKVGDGIKLHPKAPALDVVLLEPNRALVILGGTDFQPANKNDRSFLMLHTYPGYSWAFVLDEQPDQTTRFIARVRATWTSGIVSFLRNRMFLEPAHSIMQRKMIWV